MEILRKVEYGLRLWRRLPFSNVICLLRNSKSIFLLSIKFVISNIDLFYSYVDFIFLFLFIANIILVFDEQDDPVAYSVHFHKPLHDLYLYDYKTIPRLTDVTYDETIKSGKYSVILFTLECGFKSHRRFLIWF